MTADELAQFLYDELAETPRVYIYAWDITQDEQGIERSVAPNRRVDIDGRGFDLVRIAEAILETLA